MNAAAGEDQFDPLAVGQRWVRAVGRATRVEANKVFAMVTVLAKRLSPNNRAGRKGSSYRNRGLEAPVPDAVIRARALTGRCLPLACASFALPDVLNRSTMANAGQGGMRSVRGRGSFRMSAQSVAASPSDRCPCSPVENRAYPGGGW